MKLTPTFQFSAANLQDFVDCPRRFQLRYLLALRWPAVEAEPIDRHEQRVLRGQAFHRMAQQQFLGLSEEVVARSATDPDLQRWWHNYVAARPISRYCGDEEGTVVRAEFMLACEVSGYRLLAKYDVLSVTPAGQAVILDWKTSPKPTPESALRERLQTRIYPFLVAQAGAYLNGGRTIEPEDVALIYWFTELPQSPVRISYSPAQYGADGRYLTDLIRHISLMGPEDFLMTEDEDRCRFCAYRSYCDRGTVAGGLDELTLGWDIVEPLEELDLDFEQISEIAF